MENTNNPHFNTWPEFESYLDSLGLFRMQPGLDRMRAVLENLGLTRPPYLLAQGVGTNGKGSTCTFLASLARSHSFSCGLHTSPHFLDVRERIRLFRPQADSLKTRAAEPASDSTTPKQHAGEMFAEIASPKQHAGEMFAEIASPKQHAGEMFAEIASPKQHGVDAFSEGKNQKQHAGETLADKQYAGELFSEVEWLTAANEIMAHDGKILTYFELITIIAALLFKTAGVNLAIMESGLGGSFDATTAFAADLVFFTPIALDHANVLGHSIMDIAKDKAGAIRSGVAAISASQTTAAAAELQNMAQERGSELTFCSDAQAIFDKKIILGLAGQHQFANAALALQVWRKLQSRLKPNALSSAAPKALQLSEQELAGLAAAWLPGRLQMVQGNLKYPPLVLDGAHNPHGMAALGHSLACLGIAPAVTIFACLSDKEPEKIIPHLRVLSPGLILVPELPDHPRAMPAAELARLIGRPAKPVANLTEAIELARVDMLERLPETSEQSIEECRYPLLICGSLYLLAEFYRLYPECLLPNA